MNDVTTSSLSLAWSLWNWVILEYLEPYYPTVRPCAPLFLHINTTSSRQHSITVARASLVGRVEPTISFSLSAPFECLWPTSLWLQPRLYRAQPTDNKMATLVAASLNLTEYIQEKPWIVEIFLEDLLHGSGNTVVTRILHWFQDIFLQATAKPAFLD